jgi:threonine dehydrogenase-like Zn-dependent dehydrogenase
MLALAFDGAPRLVEIPEPVPGEGECLLRVVEAGICRTDLEILRGYMRYEGVLGHEFVGVAETGRLAGARVVSEINAPCGSCGLCREGLGNHCRARTVLGIQGRQGVFAERVAVPEGCLHIVPDAISDDEAVFVEPLAAALRIREQIAFTGRERVLVLGDGRLGLLCAMALAPVSASLALVGRHPSKLAVASAAGVDTITLSDFEPERENDVVVDATGRAEGFELALRSVRPGGFLVLKSTFAGQHPLNLAAIVIDELRVVGSRCGPFARALDALLRREVDPRPLISARFPLTEGVAALRSASSSEHLKVLLDVAPRA